MGLVAQERDTYEQMWAVPAYAEHSPGQAMAPIFIEIVRRLYGHAYDPASVLDAGTGSGKGALALEAAGFRVALCDLTDAGLVPEARHLPFTQTALWDHLKPRVGYQHGGQFDFVYCCDVMEHIPPAFTMLVVARLLEVARSGAFFSISLVPDAFGAWVGKPLHQSVQSFTQWRDQLATLGEVLECRDLLTTGVYFVRPRC